jgi:hypothetical protein
MILPFQSSAKSYALRREKSYSVGIRKTPETIEISEVCVRETGLEVGGSCK